MAVSPRRPKGTHLNALRAFEATARLGSFSMAAEELSVTAGAVTQHVKALEAWAGTKLFARKAHGVELTPLAEELLPRFSYAFDELGHAVQMLRTKATPNRIKIATLPSIAQLWLAPRLGRLRQIAPEVSVSVFAMEAPPNLIREPFDMTLFFSIEPTGTKNVELFRDRIYPVCSPEIAKRLKVWLKDLKSETLLHDNAWLNDWDLWLGAVPDAKGINSAGTVHSLFAVALEEVPAVHSLFAVALEEARHSGGVLMAHEALVAPLLRSGELVKPFDDDLELPHKLIASPTKAFAKTPIYERVVQVLFEEA